MNYLTSNISPYLSGVLVAVAVQAAIPAAPIRAQEGSAGTEPEVEIISGPAVAPARRDADAGIRVWVRVRFDPDRPAVPVETERRVSQPLLAREAAAVQRALAAAGHDPGGVDGILGSATRSALSSFQRSRGLGVCGCVDYATIVALGLEPRVVQTVVGDADDGSDVEVILPPSPLPPPAAPVPDTVYVVERGSEPDRRALDVLAVPFWFSHILPLPSPAPAAGRGGVPFGGRGGLRLGPVPPAPPPPPPMLSR